MRPEQWTEALDAVAIDLPEGWRFNWRHIPLEHHWEACPASYRLRLRQNRVDVRAEQVVTEEFVEDSTVDAEAFVSVLLAELWENCTDMIFEGAGVLNRAVSGAW